MSATATATNNSPVRYQKFGGRSASGRHAHEFQPEGDWYARAEAMCERALALDPDLPEARYVRSRLRWSPPGGFDHEGALLSDLNGDTASLDQLKLLEVQPEWDKAMRDAAREMEAFRHYQELKDKLSKVLKRRAVPAGQP